MRMGFFAAVLIVASTQISLAVPRNLKMPEVFAEINKIFGDTSKGKAFYGLDSTGRQCRIWIMSELRPNYNRNMYLIDVGVSGPPSRPSETYYRPGEWQLTGEATDEFDTNTLEVSGDKVIFNSLEKVWETRVWWQGILEVSMGPNGWTAAKVSVGSSIGRPPTSLTKQSVECTVRP